MEVRAAQEEAQKRIEVFCCYARKDQALLQELKNHLMPLIREGLIALWADTDINAGAEWEKEIHLHLNTSHIVLLLVSSDFMASEYCYSTEMAQAMKRHDSGQAEVIPIILRPVEWQQAPFAKLQAFPKEARPIVSSKWDYRDEGFADVARGIRKAVVARLAKEEQRRRGKAAESEQDCLVRYKEGCGLLSLKRDEEALIAFEQTLRLDPNKANAYMGKGDALLGLQQNEEALLAFEQALRLDPHEADAYIGKGDALLSLERDEEALVAYGQALRLDPNIAGAYNSKGAALLGLQRNQEALLAFEQALRLDPNIAGAYNGKGVALLGLQRNQEALLAFEQAIQLNPADVRTHLLIGQVLVQLGRYERALAAYEQVIRLDPNFAFSSINKRELDDYRLCGEILTVLGIADAPKEVQDDALYKIESIARTRLRGAILAILTKKQFLTKKQLRQIDAMRAAGKHVDDIVQWIEEQLLQYDEILRAIKLYAAYQGVGIREFGFSVDWIITLIGESMKGQKNA